MKKTYKKLISIILTITIFLQSIPIVISAKNIFDDEEVTSYYNTDTKYFAITIGWDENG